MTDQDAMLKLADIIEPSGKHEWRVAPSGKVYRPREGGGPFDWFDPANNDSQAVAVLCWLLSPALSMAHPQKQFFVVTSWSIERMRFDHEFDDRVVCWSVGIESSDPASFRAAVTKAALRVVS